MAVSLPVVVLAVAVPAHRLAEIKPLVAMQNDQRPWVESTTTMIQSGPTSTPEGRRTLDLYLRTRDLMVSWQDVGDEEVVMREDHLDAYLAARLGLETGAGRQKPLRQGWHAE